MKPINVFGIIALMILVGTIGIISAQEEIETTPENIPFSFSSWFKHTFGIQDFSIVGDFRQCDRYPTKTLYFYPNGENVLMDINAADYTSSGYGLLNFYVNNWNPFREYKNSHTRYCGFSYDQCIVEIYSCEFDECSRDSDCSDWYGSGSKCETKTADDPNIDYQSSTFNYCTEPDDIEVTCYYYSGSGNSCSTRTYIGDTTCPSTYIGYSLYESKSVCENTIPEEPINLCSIGQTKCEGTVYYTCPSGNWISQGQLNGQCGYTGNGGGGGNGDELIGEIIIDGSIEVIAPALFSDYLTTIKVPLKNFGGKSETINLEGGFYSPDYACNTAKLYSCSGTLGSIFPFFSSVPVPNVNPAEEFVKTKQVTLGPGETEIVELKVNRLAAFVTYPQGTTNVKIEPLVWFAGLYKTPLGGYTNEAGDVGKGILFDYGEYSPLSLLGGCDNLLGWKSSNILCESKVIGSCNGDILTLEKICSITSTLDVINGTPATAIVNDTFSLGDGDIGESCTVNTDCSSNFCDKSHWYSLGQTCQATPWDLTDKVSLTRKEISESTTSVLIASACLDKSHCIVQKGDVAKCIPLSRLKDEGVITKATEDKFFSKANDMINGGILGGLIGGSTGLGACLLGVGAGTTTIFVSGGTAAPVVIPAVVGISCSVLIGGGAAAGAVIGSKVALGFSDKDEIVKHLKAEDDAEVGLCVAEKSGEGLEWAEFAAWFDVTGDGKKDGTDGAIILGVLVFFAVIILRQ